MMKCHMQIWKGPACYPSHHVRTLMLKMQVSNRATGDDLSNLLFSRQCVGHESMPSCYSVSIVLCLPRQAVVHTPCGQVLVTCLPSGESRRFLPARRLLW